MPAPAPVLHRGDIDRHLAESEQIMTAKTGAEETWAIFVIIRTNPQTLSWDSPAITRGAAKEPLALRTG